MAEFLSAGVYIEEKKSQQQSISGVSTSNFATVGWLQKGPENKATLVTSLAEFLRKFGDFWKNSNVPLAMTGFFQNGGARAYVVGVRPDDAVAATVTTPGSEYLFTAYSRGTWGNNVRVKVAGNPNYYTNANATYSRFDVSIQEESEDGLGDYSTMEFFEACDLTDPDSAYYLPAVINDTQAGSELVTVQAVSGGIPVAFNSTQVSGESIGTGVSGTTQTVSATLAQTPVAKYTLEILVDGTKVASDNGNGRIQAVSGSGYTSITGTVSYTTGVVNIVFTPAPDTGLALTANYYKSGATSVNYDLTGGLDGTSVSRSQVTDPSLSADGKGIYALDEVDEMLNIGLPDFPGNEIVDGDLIGYCETRKDCFAILTTPAGISAQEAVDYKRNTLASTSNYAAIYYPLVKVADPVLDGKLKTISPVGHIAGVYARTDNTRNVGKAPAGVEDGKLNFVVSMEKILKKGEMDIIYPANVNPLVQSSAQGKAVWGSRTLQIVGDFPQIAWRRLFIFLEKSVYNSTQDLVFEPLGDGLFAATKFRLEGFLTVLAGDGYFASQVPSEAFRVICDDTNNTPQTIAARMLITDILIAVANPAEFVRFRFERSLEKLA